MPCAARLALALSILTAALSGPAAVWSRPRSPGPGPELRPAREALSPQRSRVGVLGVWPVDPDAVAARVRAEAVREARARRFDWFEPIGEPSEPVESALARDPEARTDAPAGALRLVWSARCAEGWRTGPKVLELCDGAPPPADAPVQATTQIMLGHGPAPDNGLALAVRGS